jgi:hypothetical protein
MARLRFYQLSLRRLFLLVTALAVCLWLGLLWVGRITPQRGETLVTAHEQRVLQAMKSNLGLIYERPIIHVYT